MKSWSTYIPVLTLGLSLAALVGSVFVFTRGYDPGSVGAGEFGAAPSTLSPTPLIVDPTIARAVQVTVRPDGLRELSVVAPADILMVDQRRTLLDHLGAVQLTLNVPDAMSYASRREGQMHVLTAASGRETGFFLFSQKSGTRLTTGARKFLVEYFRDAFQLTIEPNEQPFLSRFAGQLTWLRGSSSTGQRFDAFVIPGKKNGFGHLLFVYDPTVANATRRLMVDSIRLNAVPRTRGQVAR